VPWPHHPEIPLIQSCDRFGAEPFRRRDHTGIDRAQPKVRMLLDKFGNA